LLKRVRTVHRILRILVQPKAKAPPDTTERTVLSQADPSSIHTKHCCRAGLANPFLIATPKVCSHLAAPPLLRDSFRIRGLSLLL
jgi:hypothetical protein